MKKSYYIVLETGNKLVSDVIDTDNDLDTSVGLVCELGKLDEKYKSDVVILNWKRLNKKWWQRRRDE
jgi:hypothetical protein